jgi:hypothetical protein
MSNDINDALGLTNNPQQSRKHDTISDSIDNRLQSDNANKKLIKKYPALRTLSTVFWAIAWIIAALTMITTISLFKVSSESGNWIMPFAAFAIGAILFISLLAYSEIIIVFVDIEENTRKSALK